MADDNDSLSALINMIGTGAQYGVGSAAVGGANAAQQAAYAAILKNLQNQFGDYSNLGTPGYQNLTPQQVGPSALAGIQPDAQARTSEQAAIDQLGDIANHGGLDTSDMAALNQIQGNLSQQNSARQSALANQFAARGQLGSGAQLAMSLADQQNAATNANQAGENTAGQAQQRAIQAVLQKAQASRTMANDDLQRQTQAAQAADAIAKYNAGARTGASEYNNSLQGQSYADQLAKLAGQGQTTNSLNSALLGQGNVSASNALAQGQLAGGLIGAGSGIVSGLSKLGSGGNGNNGNAPGIPPDQLSPYPGSDGTGNSGAPPTPPPDTTGNGNPGTKLTEGDTATAAEDGTDGLDPSLLDSYP